MKKLNHKATKTRSGLMSCVLALLICATVRAGDVTPLAHVEQRGTGPTTLILVPGLSCDWTVYDAFMKRNEAKYTMYAITLPGFGKSDAPPKDSNWLDNAELAIEQLVKDRKLDRPIVVGHSLGGHLATRLAIHHPENFRGAISLDGLPLFPMPMPGHPDSPDSRKAMVEQMHKMMGNMTDDQWVAGQKRSCGYLVTDPKRAEELGAMCSAVPRATTEEYMCELIGYDIRPELAKVGIPLLTIAAVSSEMGPEVAANIRKAVTEEFKTAPANVKLEFLDGSRHFIMDDKPAELDKFVADFVASLQEKK